MVKCPVTGGKSNSLSFRISGLPGYIRLDIWYSAGYLTGYPVSVRISNSVSIFLYIWYRSEQLGQISSQFDIHSIPRHNYLRHTRWFHLVKDQTVNVTIRQHLYCKISSYRDRIILVQRLANCHIDSLIFDKVKPPRLKQIKLPK